MAIDYEALRVRIGLVYTDNSKDTEIALAYNTALALIETWCDRKFERQDEAETFTHVTSNTVSLIRYPVDHIIQMDSNVSKYHLEKKNGVVHFDSFEVEHEIKIAYNGGYATLPPDLLVALYGTFDQVYNAQTNPGGSVSAGNIKTVRAGDLSVTYDNSGGATPNSGGAFGGLIPLSAMSILDLYRRESA